MGSHTIHKPESAGAAGAPDTLSYLTVSNTASLSAERALAVAARLTKTDGGANSTLTLDMASGIVAPGTYTSVTVDTYGRTTGGTNPTVAPLAGQYVTLATHADLTQERVLTGTANQITITDNGAGSTVVLSTPQDLHSAATPTFAGIVSNGTSADVFNATATTVNFAGDATTLTIGATTGTCTIRNDLTVLDGDVEISIGLVITADGTFGAYNLEVPSGLTAMFVENLKTATAATIAIATLDADGTDDVGLLLYGKGNSGSLTNTEILRLGYSASGTRFQIKAENGGTGTLRDIWIGHESGSLQDSIIVHASGDVSLMNIPSADPGVVGKVYRSGGTLMISI